MELEEMKSLWGDMSRKLEQQEVTNKKIIMEMTQQKFKNKFRTLSMYENFGALVCFGAAILIFLNLNLMNTWYLMTCSLIAIGFLLLLPIFVLRAIYNMKKLDLGAKSYKETIKGFAKNKKVMLFVSQFSVVFGVAIMWITIPIFSMIFNNKDFFKQDHNLSFYIFTGAISVLVFLFSIWGYKCYKRITSSAEALLGELKE